MPDDSGQFKRSLLRMLQTGAFQTILGCEEGQCAAVRFHLERIYQVQLNRRTIVVQEQDREAVHRQTHGRWTLLGRPAVSRSRIVLDRDTRKILRAPGLGVAKSMPRQRPPGTRPYRLVSVRTILDHVQAGLPSDRSV